jgi:hypothetical protein
MSSRSNLLAAVTIAAFALVGQPAAAGEILFSAAPGSIIRDTGKAGEPILIPRATTQVRLDGHLFDPPIAITPAGDGGRHTIAAALAADFADNLSGDSARIADGYAAAERPDLHHRLSGEKLDYNTTFFRSIDDMLYLGYATHADHVIVLVDYRFGGDKRRSLAFTMTKEDGRYVRSNALSGDRTYGVVFAAVWNDTYEPVPRRFSAYGETTVEAAPR